MHFDDRLATVLQLPASSPAIARIQFRQLLDLLAPKPNGTGPLLDAAYARLQQLRDEVSAADRARILAEPMVRLTNPDLVAQFALCEPQVASAAIAVADLSEADWLELIPALPVRARGIVRHKRGLGPKVEALLDRLGIGDRGLSYDGAVAAALARPELTVVSRSGPATGIARETADTGIGAIVRKIEEYRKTRAASAAPAGSDEDMAPARASVVSLDFATDTDGRVTWADGPAAPALVGWHLAGLNDDDGSAPLRMAIRHRQPVSGLMLSLPLAPALEGRWRVDAIPRFDSAGRFIGYAGRLRRPPATDQSSARQVPSEVDRMRQILHELRTPANAIQIASEIIQQQLYGPAPHEYRALAAAIAGDTAQILAGFDELDRLVRLESGRQSAEHGECDLGDLISRTVSQLQSWTAPRGSGFALPQPMPHMPVRISEDEAGGLLWRLLASLAGASEPGEVLPISTLSDADMITVTLRMPRSLAAGGGEDLPHVSKDAERVPSSGMFGIGFTLRLARAEAAAAGGALERAGSVLHLTLPGSSAQIAGHRHAL